MLTFLKSRNKPLAAFVSLAALGQIASGETPAKSTSPGRELAVRVLQLSDSERVYALLALSMGEREDFYRALDSAQFIALGRKALAGLGVYRARLVKSERVGKRTCGPDVVEITVRENPRAVLVDFVGGQHKGRRALYNVQLRPHEMLARESGILGLFPLWLSLDSGLARRDTNHSIAEVGFGAMMDLMQRDQTNAAAAGGYRRQNEGFDARGLYCILFSAPPGARNLYAKRLRFCVDGGLGLPLKIEIFDDQGLRERVEYLDLHAHLTLPSDFFTPKGAGL